MELSVLLIIISALAALLALWRDELVELLAKNPAKQAVLHETLDETPEDKNKRLVEALKKAKLRNVKLLSTLLIFLTLGFSLRQIHLSAQKASLAAAAQLQAHIKDSTRYADDSIIHLQERQIDSGKIDKLLIKVVTDSLNFLKQQLASNQIITLQNTALITQKQYNDFLTNEIEKQKRPLLPLKLWVDVVTDPTREAAMGIINDNVPATLNLTCNFGLYNNVTAKDHISSIFQKDSALLRQRFDDFTTYKTFRLPANERVLSLTSGDGATMNRDRNLTSIMELNNKILNVQFPYGEFKIRSLTLISGPPGNEVYTDLELTELFKNTYDEVVGRWYSIRIKEKYKRS